MDATVPGPLFKVAAFLGLVGVQGVLLAGLFFLVYRKPFRAHVAHAVFTGRAPVLLSISILGFPLVMWAVVQAGSRGLPQAVLVTPDAVWKQQSGDGSGRGRAAAEGAEPWNAALSASPEQIDLGVRIVQEQNCQACHRIKGRGASVAPDLSGVGSRRGAQWIWEHFRAPHAVSPGTFMPRFQLDDRQLLALTGYMLSLRD